jgi:ribosomal protein L11 methyltransferase
MLQHFALHTTVSPSELERLSLRLQDLESFRGLQEMPSEEEGLFAVPEGLEFQEFGSEAARRFDEHLEKQSRAQIPVQIFFEIEVSEQAQVEATLGLTSARWELLDNKDYVDEYKQHVRGNFIGRNIWVGPPWDVPASKATFSYIIDPGLGFGTGEHPTTQMCLLQMEALQAKLKAPKILDLGSGSGILSLAALDFFPGAEVWAADLDPNCREETQKNFSLNGKDAALIQSVFGPEAQLMQLRSRLPAIDLLVSNIYVNVLLDLLPDICKLLAPGKLWLLSGIIANGSEKALEEAAAPHFKILRRETMLHPKDASETWLSLLLERV